MLNLQKPAINAPTAQGQIDQIRSFLFRLMDELEGSNIGGGQANSDIVKRLDAVEKQIKEIKYQLAIMQS